jgi:hypothetical protein
MRTLDYENPQNHENLRQRFRKRWVLYALIAWIFIEIFSSGVMTGGSPMRLPVRVCVTDARTGLPVPGASVLMTPHGPRTGTSASTDAAGVAVPKGYFFRQVTYGLLLARYDLTSTDKTTASAPGYLTKTVNGPLKTWKFTVFNIGAGPQAKLDISLTPIAPPSQPSTAQ